MGMQPVLGFRVLRVDLSLSQVRSTLGDKKTGVFIAPSLGQQRPEICFAIVLRNASSRQEERRRFGLRTHVPLLGCPQEPAHGLAVILFDAVTGSVAPAQRVLCL